MTGFTPEARAGMREGVESSADILVPRLYKLFEPESLLDVGCGEGYWCERFVEEGVPFAHGIDFDAQYRQHVLDDRVVNIEPAELNEPLKSNLRDFDLTLCLEVAEHLRPERAESFVDDLCRTSDMIVFSAAIPGQGGVNHLNEQWPDYWAKLFADRGFMVSGGLRFSIWEDKSIEWWYRQNLLIVMRNATSRPMPPWFWSDLPPMRVVHPDAWTALGYDQR